MRPAREPDDREPDAREPADDRTNGPMAPMWCRTAPKGRRRSGTRIGPDPPATASPLPATSVGANRGPKPRRPRKARSGENPRTRSANARCRDRASDRRWSKTAETAPVRTTMRSRSLCPCQLQQQTMRRRDRRRPPMGRAGERAGRAAGAGAGTGGPVAAEATSDAEPSDEGSTVWRAGHDRVATGPLRSPPDTGYGIDEEPIRPVADRPDRATRGRPATDAAGLSTVEGRPARTGSDREEGGRAGS